MIMVFLFGNLPEQRLQQITLILDTLTLFYLFIFSLMTFWTQKNMKKKNMLQ